MDDRGTMREKKDFGQYIRAKREEAGMSQRELARRLHLVESAVSKWERGLSYPDVTIVPDVCRELGISEHEFFMACDDESQRARDRSARRWEAMCRGWKWTSTVLCACAAVVCFICDLAVCHALDWFWIVLAGLGVFWCVTTLPLWLARRRALWSMGSASVCLLLLLLTCWLYVGGQWVLGGLVITAVCLMLPWGAYALARWVRGNRDLWAMGLFSLWLLGLLTTVWLFTGGDWLWVLGLPIALLCLGIGWLVLGVLRLPVNGWFKGALIAALAALSIPLGNTVPFIVLEGRFDAARFAGYFFPQFPLPVERLGNQITLWTLLGLAAALTAVGVARHARKDR